MNAFMAGAKEVNPKVEFSVSFISSWFDPPKAKEAAFAMIDKGADVMYAERFGVSRCGQGEGQARDRQRDRHAGQVSRHRGRLGAVEHGADDRPRAQAVKDGKFKAEDYGPYSMMKHKGSELAPLGTFEKKVPADLVRPRSRRRRRPSSTASSRSRSTTAEPKSTRVSRGAPAGCRQRRLEPARPASVLRCGITKRFGALVANDAISLELARGEVLALLGENGAGKSTLVSILFGHYVADEGTIEAFGAPLPPGDPAAALAAGIGMVHQHFTLADNLTRARQRDARHRAAVAAVLAARARRARRLLRRRAALRPAR